VTDGLEGRAGSAGSPWDFDYRERGRIWGDGPSELLKATLPLVRRAAAEKGRLRILDIGCGYGRDVAALIAEVDADVLAVDPSCVAVEMARAQLTRRRRRRGAVLRVRRRGRGRGPLRRGDGLRSLSTAATD
jgi:SAM-dependent methyltransferase